jgi:hypothetical protein
MNVVRYVKVVIVMWDDISSSLMTNNFFSISEYPHFVNISNNFDIINLSGFKVILWVEVKVSRFSSSESEMEFKGVSMNEKGWCSVISSTTISESIGSKSENI